MRLLTPSAFGALSLLLAAAAPAQPKPAPDGVAFEYTAAAAKSVNLVGDFNGWSKDETPMRREGDRWSAVLRLRPGVYQYKFVVDGSEYVLDPVNPASVENYNSSGRNSVFALGEDGVVALQKEPVRPLANRSDDYSARPGTKPLHLNIIWHQHQPLYVDPAQDALTGPWVRTHATKDYYDMTAMLREYPEIHVTVNLTSSLLHQLRTYYVDRIGPFVDRVQNRVDVRGFRAKWKGKTDPWIDLALTPAERFGEAERGYLYRNVWNAFGISEVQIARFPEYRALKSRLPKEGPLPANLFTTQEMREIVFWFYLAHFDPDFLEGPVRLAGGAVVDLSDLVSRGPDGMYRLRRKVNQDDCNRMVAEAVKVSEAVIPLHRAMRYEGPGSRGQVEVITTPFYHPILPLIYDSDLARICQPNDALPSRFSFPEDADAQVAKAVRMYSEIFGAAPTGMWPGEGSVAQPVLDVLRRNGILWTASDVKVLARSRPSGMPNTTPYRFPAGKEPSGAARSMAVVFRDTELSDRIGFKYQTYDGEEAAEDFIRNILSLAPKEGEPDGLLTVILDGENAWEWYRKDNDAKVFLNALYRKLTRLHRDRQVITVTAGEYFEGNPSRGVAPHPVESLPAMEWLHPGSWINGNYDTWIGEPEENEAWEYLLRARRDLASTGFAPPDPAAPVPRKGTKEWHRFMAWESMYAAEGSDWFWWYGADQAAPAGDRPFDEAFRVHLKNVYSFARSAGASITPPAFAPIIRGEQGPGSGQGAMAQSRETQAVLFVCDARAVRVPEAVSIAGNTPDLGAWRPNTLRLYDDGRNGDEKAGDGFWSLLIDLPAGMEIQYKYTNSGREGDWAGEEFAGRHRSFRLEKQSGGPVVRRDLFGSAP